MKCMTLFKHQMKKIASCSNDGQIKIWNFNNCECVKTIETGASIIYFHNFSEEIIQYRSENKLKLWNIRTKKCWKTIDIGSNVFEIKKKLVT